jgi:myo-inositol 2-dehydrogenase / D-chiro-inositol 1-dehydrogenase
MQKSKVNIGVVGLGRLGYIHAENIAFKIKNANLFALCDSDDEKLQTAKLQLGVEHTYSSFSGMLGNKELDAVAIVSPSAFHCDQIKQALEAGLHVFCEKPLGIGLEDSMKAKKVVDAHPDKVFVLGFMRRYDKSYQYAKRKVDDGEIGEPILFRGYSVDPVSTIESTIQYIPHSAGQFTDMSVHDIDLARWFLKSEPKSVFAIGGCFSYPEFGEFGDGDNVSALMQFENNAMAFLYSGRTAPHGYNVETEIIGTRGTLRIASVPQKNLVEIIDSAGIRKECSQSFQERFADAFVNEMQEFVDCIVYDRKPDINVDDGVESSKIAELATKSFKTNKLINL